MISISTLTHRTGQRPGVARVGAFAAVVPGAMSTNAMSTNAVSTNAVYGTDIRTDGTWQPATPKPPTRPFGTST